MLPNLLYALRILRRLCGIIFAYTLVFILTVAELILNREYYSKACLKEYKRVMGKFKLTLINFVSHVVSYFVAFSTPIHTCVLVVLILIKIFYVASMVGPFSYIIIYCDSGSLVSFLISLEHSYVCYYLLFILVVVYWALYLCLWEFWGNEQVSRIKPLINLYQIKNTWIFKKCGQLKNELIVEFSQDIPLPLRGPCLQVVHRLIFFIIDYIIIRILKNIELLDKTSWARVLVTNWKKKEVITDALVRTIKFYDKSGTPWALKNNQYFFNIFYVLLFLANWKNFTISYKMFKRAKRLKTIMQYLFILTPNAYYFFKTIILSSVRTQPRKNNWSMKRVYNNYYILQLRAKYYNVLLINNFKHSGLFETVWALFPSAIIICILIPSLILLYSFEDVLNPYITIKVIGNQWYWTYEFNNWISVRVKPKNVISSYDPLKVDKSKNVKFIKFSYDSIIVTNSDEMTMGKRLLEVSSDQKLILPINATIRFLITSADVLHAFAVPELGFKVDAVPGRLNQVLTFISKPGLYYGQCSELCGANHAFMPIVIHAVKPDVYVLYLKKILGTDVIKIVPPIEELSWWRWFWEEIVLKSIKGFYKWLCTPEWW